MMQVSRDYWDGLCSSCPRIRGFGDDDVTVTSTE